MCGRRRRAVHAERGSAMIGMGARRADVLSGARVARLALFEKDAMRADRNWFMC